MPALIRDFRGSMQGRAEKGLIPNTGRFSQEAQKEANRDSVPPIALIDGERPPPFELFLDHLHAGAIIDQDHIHTTG